MHAGYLLVEFRRKREWSQADLAHAIGFTKGVMSELENGKRLLSGRYLQKIESAHILDEHELRMLREQAAIDRVRGEYGVDFSEHLAHPFESLEDLLKNLRVLRRKDGFTGTGEVLPTQIRLLQMYRDRYPADRRRVERLLAKALIERLDGFRQTLLPHEIEVASWEGLGELRFLHERLSNDPEDLDLAQVLPITVSYVAGKLMGAELFEKLIGQLSEPYPLMICARGLVTTNAILKRQGKISAAEAIYKFHRAEETAHAVLSDERISLGEKASIYEALSLGTALLGLPNAHLYLREAKVAHQQAGLEGRLAVMDGLIIRTEVVNLVLDKDVDVQTILKVSESGARVAKEYGYKRQRAQIIDHLLGHSDDQVQRLGEYLRSTG